MRKQILIDPRGRPWSVDVPESRRERMRGLRDRRWLAPDHALLLTRCRSVHTFGMSFAIAVVLLDAGLKVVAVRRTSPRRVLLPHVRARHVLECPVDTDLRPGDHLLLDGFQSSGSATVGRLFIREPLQIGQRP